MKRVTGMAIGVVLIACGIVYALGVFGVVDMNVNISIDGWWTLFIIVPSIIGLVTNKENKLWNVFCLLLGIYLLLASREVIDYAMGIKLLVPVVIILLGIKLIAKSALQKKKTDDSEQSGE